MKDHLRHIPNALTILRICMALIFPFYYKDWATSIIIFAAMTEFLDGFIARRFNWGTALGALLDPAADKLFFSIAVTLMFFTTDLQWWVFLLVGMRDLVVLVASLGVALEGNWKAFLHVTPRMLGKLTTTFQYVVLILYFCFHKIFDEMLVLTAIVSIVSSVDYLVLYFKNDRYRNVL